MLSNRQVVSLGPVTEVPGYDPSAYPPFAVTVDVVLFTVRDGRLEVLLVRRDGRPFKGNLALPGGFVHPDEDLDEAAVRELVEETGIHPEAGLLEQLGAYGAVDRDPRMRVVSVAYWAIVPTHHLGDPVAGSDAADARFYPASGTIEHPGVLAFDHHLILRDAIERAQQALETSTVATRFCPPEFTLADLRTVYEAVWRTGLDPSNFQRKVLKTPGFVEPTGDLRRGEWGRPPELFRAGPATELDPPFRRPDQHGWPWPTERARLHMVRTDRSTPDRRR